ncbi:MAG: glycosyltransferase family 4 protein [Cyanobacteriota bacterium]
MDTAPWGGSENLWSQTARCLRQQGHKVTASVHGWETTPPQVLDLQGSGVEIYQRSPFNEDVLRRWKRRLSGRPFCDLSDHFFQEWLVSDSPDLVCFSDGRVASRPDWGHRCRQAGIPYVNLSQANSSSFWPDDPYLQSTRNFLLQALRCFFVSHSNWNLCEMQIGHRLVCGEVVRNPFSVPFAVAPSRRPPNQFALELAAVGRLEPVSKGQDLLFSVLAQEKWRDRSWRLSLFGSGTAAQSLQDLVHFLGLDSHVFFRGYTHDIADLWNQHDILVLPSRHEGLPIAAVEAMMCHRPVMATDVGGNREVIKDGETGFIAESPSFAALDRTLERVWQEKDRLHQMGLQAGQSIRELVPPRPEEEFSHRLVDLLTKP